MDEFETFNFMPRITLPGVLHPVALLASNLGMMTMMTMIELYFVF